jgi:putative DNA primase/helicase
MADALVIEAPTSSAIEGNDPRISRHTTDAGNAEVLVARYGDKLRFDHARGRWLLWQGNRWQPDDDEEVRRIALQVLRSRIIAALDYFNDPDDPHRKKIISNALGSETTPRLNSIIRIAGTMHPVADNGEGWDTKTGIAAAPNGVIDLRTGELREGRPEDRITKQLGVAYDPAAECPTFDKFIRQVCSGDEDLVRLLQRLFGYTLTGEATLDLLLFLMGVGRNGKSTLLSAVERVFGDYAHDLPALALQAESRSAHTTEVHGLEGSRLATAKEIADQKLNASRLKQLAGGDGLTARALYKNNVYFPQTWQLILMTNHEPKIDDTGGQSWIASSCSPSENASRRTTRVPIRKWTEARSRTTGNPSLARRGREGLLPRGARRDAGVCASGNR